MKIALLGTGLMGAVMGRRLLEAGHELVVHNRTAEKCAPLVEAGAHRADHAADAIASTEVCLVMLSDAHAVRSVVLDSDADLGGRLVVQMSTVGPDENLALAASIEARGGAMLEAPVLGSTPQANAGRLVVMAAGERAHFDRVRDVLAVFGPEPRFVGPMGRGAAMKLACNHLIAAEAAAFALSLAMVRRSGIDIDQFVSVLRDSVLFAPLFGFKLENMRQRAFQPATFPTEHLLKDVRLGQRLATELGLDPRALTLLRSVLEETRDAGHGRDDFSSLVQTIDPV